MTRHLLGLAVGSGLEGVDSAVITTEGIGLDQVPRVRHSVRVAFPAVVRDQLRPPAGSSLPGGEALSPPDLIRNIADTAVHAIRTVLNKTQISSRDLFAGGFLEPARASGGTAIPWVDAVDIIVEQTGLTLLHGFRSRDRAAGGSGHPITAAAEYLLLRSPTEDRCLIRLGAAAAVTVIPARATITGMRGCEVGPGNQLLDALVFHGTRGREHTDPGGKKAVQGYCLEKLLSRWLEHPFLSRQPPKAVHPETFGRAFLLSAFESARQEGRGLPDLLCTATHFVARAIGAACRSWAGESGRLRWLVAGGGTRNGFLWQLLGQQSLGNLERADAVGFPVLGGNAAAAAVLAVLNCDGVPGNLPGLTGAAAGRLIGHFTPGDARNWGRCAAWLADQTGEYPRAGRAA